MKRLTALALTLVVLLLLFLTGCADTQQNGDRLQDKLNTKQVPETQEPTQTDLPDTTKTSTTEKTPSKGNTAQRPGEPEPEEGAPVGEDYSNFEGIYVADTSGDENTTVLQISLYGDILLLEYSYLSDGVLFGTWVEEFWPDPDVFEDGKLESVCGALFQHSLRHPHPCAGRPLGLRNRKKGLLRKSPLPFHLFLVKNKKNTMNRGTDCHASVRTGSQ